MLKTNSKKAKENVRAYILKHFDPSDYGEWTGNENNFSDVARFIFQTFKTEKRYTVYIGKGSSPNFEPSFAGFIDWCQGLPSVLNTCYFYNRSAVADLAVILEETEEETKRYAESDAEKLLTLLIWREIEKENKK